MEQLNSEFSMEGMFADMSMPLADYTEKTREIPKIHFAFYEGPLEVIKAVVARVDEEWVTYFDGNCPLFCGFDGDTIVSFCIVEEDAGEVKGVPGTQVGSIGCVGTVPEYRGRGIGLRMVDLATVHLKEIGCDKGYIHYTHIDHWYEKLGYQTFTRFS